MIYTIKKGNHYSNLLNPNRMWIGYNVRRIDFNFQFLNNPSYSFVGDDFCNKLFGLSFGMNHHKDSYRIGWMANNNLDTVSTHNYYYNHGERKPTEPIYIQNYNSFVSASILVNRSENKINTWLRIGGNYINKGVDFDFNGVSKFSKLLLPYFGGLPTAPHTIYMDLTIENIC